LRAELENGSVAIKDAYNLLTDRVKNSIMGDLSYLGGAAR